jgi:CDP-diacylglycerol--serine O-phosphatidyltransferase
MLPIYLGLLGMADGQAYVLYSALFAVAVAGLMVSRIPVYCGKASGPRVRRDLVMPLMLGIVIYVALLFSYTWLTMSVTVLAFLASWPLSMRSYRRREAATTRSHS